MTATLIVLALAALAVLGALHWFWRRKFQQAEQNSKAEIERVRAEQQQALVRLETQQEALFDSIVEGLVVLDEQGRIQLANRAFINLFGLTTDVRSRTLIETVRLHELAELVESLGTEKQVVGKELRLPLPVERWVGVNGAAISNGQGRRHGTILLFHDLTRVKQLENTRKDFVANVSHELRTPLSLIQGYVETLLDGAMDNPLVAPKFLRTIQRNTDRLRLLIEDLLVISELESGRVKLNLQLIALRPTVQKVFEDFKSRANARKIRLCNESPALTFTADPGRLEQVLGNLVENAIKYGRTEGSVTVRSRLTEDAQVEISVQDDGPGIPPESLARLFERFYRVDRARSREQGGTGLGLSIVKHIVQTHGGRVWAESQLGHGATFFFTLPQEPKPAEPPPE